MTYTSDKPRKPARITTYPMRGPNGEDRRYIVGPVNEVKALAKTMLEAVPGSRVTWLEENIGLDVARYEILLPQLDRSGE